MSSVELGAWLTSAMLLAAYGCAGDHDRLAKDDPVGGEGGVGGMGGASTTTATTGGGGTGGIQEPPGPPRLTMVNGTVDEDALRFCFVPYPDGPSDEVPWPAGERLAYAAAATVPIDEVIPAGTDVELVLLAGPLGASHNLDCGELIASTPAGVLIRSVGVLPESVFTTEKSILFVSAGCVGGRDHEHEDQELICGKGYANDLPTATLVAGFMSRLADTSKVPLQFVLGSLGVSDVAVRVMPGAGATAQQAVDKWTFGAIAPYPPFMALGVTQLGNPSQSSIELYAPGSSSPLVSTLWAQPLDNGGLTADDVRNGDGLAFVAVGPAPSIAPGPWWNGFTYVAVRADPD